MHRIIVLMYRSISMNYYTPNIQFHQLLPILCIACQNESETVNLIPQTRDRRMYYSVGVLYFDHLLMKRFSGIATCHAAILPHNALSTEESPEVICGKPFVIVKLPAKRIKSVKVLGMSRQLPRAVLWNSHHTVFVKLKRSTVKDGIFRLDYLDVAGKLQTVMLSCVQQTFKKDIRK
ncbi:hypothetical protein cypCar_00044822 [Cyprinus carpio]|nr:hypothetical protein cypCar_00044822 [Cyprinus carpio]